MAKIALLEGGNSGGKWVASPAEQAIAAAFVKRARTKKHQKCRKSNSSEESEDLFKPTKDMVAKAIVEPIFVTVKFAKGPGTTKKLASCCLRFWQFCQVEEEGMSRMGFQLR